MIDIYDYENAHLFLDIGENFKFDLQLKPPYTAITGDAATGKTLLVRSIIKYNELANREGQSTNIRAFLRGMEIKDIEDVNRCLIVMDKAAKYMTEELHAYIRRDINNHYLLMSRVALGLDMLPDDVGEFVADDDNVIKIYYEQW